MKAGLISCVIPVRNGARYIEEALESIFHQTYGRLEIFVIDDGSTDGTGDVVARFGDRVKYFSCNFGNSVSARNRGIRESQGEYVAFLDADDWWHPEKLALQLKHLQTHPKDSICVCHVQNFISPDAVKKMSDGGPYGKPVPGFTGSAMLVPRSVFERLGRFDESIRHSAELDWFLRARAQSMHTGVLKEILVYRRLHGSNLSITHSEASRSEHLRVIRAAIKRSHEADISESSPARTCDDG